MSRFAVNKNIHLPGKAGEFVSEVFGIFEEDSSHVIEEYRRDSFLIGKTVEVHPFITEDKSVYEAKVIDISWIVSVMIAPLFGYYLIKPAAKADEGEMYQSRFYLAFRGLLNWFLEGQI